jgi:hypothetical protein
LLQCSVSATDPCCMHAGGYLYDLTIIINATT